MGLNASAGDTGIFSVPAATQFNKRECPLSIHPFFDKLRKPNMSLLFINCLSNFYFIHRIQMDSVYAMRKQILHLTFGVI